MKKYPKNWDVIRDTILMRAGGKMTDPKVGARCEICGVRNYSVGHRESGKFILYEESDDYMDAKRQSNALNKAYKDKHFIVIVLTIAHIYDETPGNVNLANLKALCQQCHNRLDAKRRAERRKAKNGTATNTAS